MGRRPVIGSVSGRDELLLKVSEGGASSVRERLVREINAARELSGLREVGEIAMEYARSGSTEKMRQGVGIAIEIRDLTLECIQMFQSRGFELRKIGFDYERALGYGHFREAALITEDQMPADVVDTVLRRTEEAWTQLREEVTAQGEARRQDMASNPEPEETLNQRIERSMKSVWIARRPRLGNRVEDFRSGIGLRTLAALEEKYRRQDSEGSEQALPKAYRWVERAYWLTKKSIRAMSMSPYFSANSHQLVEIGAQYESDLGDSEPGKGMRIDVEQRNWPFIATFLETTSQTWNEIKKTVPKEKQ